MDLRRVRYGGGAFKLAKDLQRYLYDDECAAWLVPVEEGEGDENYMALVAGSQGYVRYIRHVGEVSVDEAVRAEVVKVAEEPSKVPVVTIPIRHLIPGHGVELEETKPTNYLGYRISKADVVPPSAFDYKLDLDALGRDLEKFRESQDWTMADAAIRAGMSEHTWCRLEFGAGKQPSAETLLRLLQTMEVSDYGKYMTLKSEDS